jgi:hypothetical protein
MQLQRDDNADSADELAATGEAMIWDAWQQLKARRIASVTHEGDGRFVFLLGERDRVRGDVPPHDEHLVRAVVALDGQL